MCKRKNPHTRVLLIYGANKVKNHCIRNEEKRMKNEHPSYGKLQNTSSPKLDWIPPELIIPFICHAIMVCSKAALEVYLQIFGGFHLNEAFNLKVEDFESIDFNNTDGLVIQINDYKAADGVSKTPHVVINVIDLFSKIFEDHLNLCCPLKSGYLFTDSNGLRMKTQSYRHCFDTVHESFINYLDKSEDLKWKEYAEILSESYWSNFICRSTYFKLFSEYNMHPEMRTLIYGRKILASQIYFGEVYDENICKKISEKFSKSYASQVSKFHEE